MSLFQNLRQQRRRIFGRKEDLRSFPQNFLLCVAVPLLKGTVYKNEAILRVRYTNHFGCAFNCMRQCCYLDFCQLALSYVLRDARNAIKGATRLPAGETTAAHTAPQA